MRAAIVSGMVTREAPVSYWPIFFHVPSNSPSPSPFAEVNSAQIPSPCQSGEL